jgi:hypothetical protein
MSIKVIAGKLVGLADNKLVCHDDETGKDRITEVRGYYIYVQKCIRPEIEDGIAIPEKSRTDHVEGTSFATMCQVLAIGSKCGTVKNLTNSQKKFCERDAEYKEIMTSTAIDYKVMDKVMIKDEYAHKEAIINSPWNRDEFFVMDSLPFAKIEE